jgi:hypothetical protein
VTAAIITLAILATSGWATAAVVALRQSGIVKASEQRLARADASDALIEGYRQTVADLREQLADLEAACDAENGDLRRQLAAVRRRLIEQPDSAEKRELINEAINDLEAEMARGGRL